MTNFKLPDSGSGVFSAHLICNRVPNTDLVLCDLQNFPAFGYGRGALFLPDSVLAVISVKTVLQPHELPTFFREATAFKGLQGASRGF
jgi:hypothetical protein